MANPFRNLLQKDVVMQLPSRAKWAVMGLADDFWHDGPNDPLAKLFAHKRIKTATERLKSAAPPPLKLGGFAAQLRARLGALKTSQTKSNKDPKVAFVLDEALNEPFAREAPPVSPASPVIWHALPGEVAEKMWGDGFVLPGGNAMVDMLIRPIGLDKQTEVLDLSAGLGGFLHKAATEFGAYVTSLEADPALAIRANEILVRSGKSKIDSINYYTPETFAPAKTVTKVYDCVVAREVFYRLQDKHKFFTSIAVCTKPQAQLTFTDYILNPEDRNNPGVLKWIEHETNAKPLGLIEMAEAWAQAGFKLRVHDDQTHFYRRDVLLGLQRLAKYMASGMRPDTETRADIARRMDLWTYRLMAMEQGLKLFRFYGTK